MDCYADGVLCHVTKVGFAIAALRTRMAVEVGGTVRLDVPPFKDAARIFARNEDCDEYNNAKLASITTSSNPIVVIHAKHARQRENGLMDYTTPIPSSDIPTETDECAGLQRVVRLNVGSRVMLRRNILTSDGLVNGAIGTVTRFVWSDGTPGQLPPSADAMPSYVSVLFDDPSVGRLTRAQARPGQDIGAHDPIDIQPSTARFKSTTNAYDIMRVQFPMSLAWAFTVHKCQGISLDAAVLDLRPTIFADGQAYVALSRVRTLDGVALLRFVDASVKMVSRDVLLEYHRLGFLERDCYPPVELPDRQRGDPQHIREAIRGAAGAIVMTAFYDPERGYQIMTEAAAEAMAQARNVMSDVQGAPDLARASRALALGLPLIALGVAGVALRHVGRGGRGRGRDGATASRSGRPGRAGGAASRGRRGGRGPRNGPCSGGSGGRGPQSGGSGPGSGGGGGPGSGGGGGTGFARRFIGGAQNVTSRVAGL